MQAPTSFVGKIPHRRRGSGTRISKENKPNKNYNSTLSLTPNEGEDDILRALCKKVYGSCDYKLQSVSIVKVNNNCDVVVPKKSRIFKAKDSQKKNEAGKRKRDADPATTERDKVSPRSKEIAASLRSDGVLLPLNNTLPSLSNYYQPFNINQYLSYDNSASYTARRYYSDQNKQVDNCILPLKTSYREQRLNGYKTSKTIPETQLAGLQSNTRLTTREGTQRTNDIVINQRTLATKSSPTKIKLTAFNSNGTADSKPKISTNVEFESPCLPEPSSETENQNLPPSSPFSYDPSNYRSPTVNQFCPQEELERKFFEVVHKGSCFSPDDYVTCEPTEVPYPEPGAIHEGSNKRSLSSEPYDPSDPITSLSFTLNERNNTKIRSEKKIIVNVKLEDDKIKILDFVPNNKIQMHVRDKFLKKLNRKEHVDEEVKLVLKPHFNKKHINKEEYKDIMRRSVPKICHSKSGEITRKKIHNFIEAYVKMFRHSKKVSSSSSVNPRK